MKMRDTTQSGDPELRRALGLIAITAFGVGDILGAGVYGLVGRIAGMVGNAAWMSYVVAGLTAALTGLTYAEFASRYPRAGGAAHFCQSVFHNSFITFFVIYFVVLSGLFSIGTSSRIFSNYAMANLPGAPAFLRDYAAPLIFVLMICVVAVRGIVLSSAANAVCTVIEVSGLLAIIAMGLRWLGSVNYMEFAPAQSETITSGHLSMIVFSGASMAFFAFIGFEDLTNLSEEVRDPERNIPLAICLAILITTLIYCSIAVVCVSVLSPAALSASGSPLIDVVSRAAPGFPIWIYSIIPAFAVFNTALLNLLMASRIMYGMSRQDSRILPSALAYIHPAWRTPVVGVAVSFVVVAGLIIFIREVTVLAAGTASFLLVVFLLLHVALLKVKLTAGYARAAFQVPAIVPVLGILTTIVLLTRQETGALRTAGLLAVVGFALYASNRLIRGKIVVEAID